METKKWVSIGVGAVTLIVGGAAIAQAHDHHGDHGHEGHAAAEAKLMLNAGQKWKTDAPLRAGMQAMRDEVQKAVEPIHAKTYTAAQYTALAGQLQKELVSIMAQCKLPPDADAQLHILLIEFFGGVETMKAEGDRMKGAARIIGGLETYAEYFEHSGWKAIEH